jgi:lysophospholipase L1-like esterase
MALGVTPLSWAQWLARALDLPFTSYAVNGASTRDVRERQVPRVRAHYDVACVYTGVNDVRAPGFDARAYERDLDAVLGALARRAPRVLVLTLPHDLGRPTCAPKPLTANAIVRRLAAGHGALVADLGDFGGWTRVLPDAVHPTAVGQLEIADRAARVLRAPVVPSVLAASDPGALDRARYAPARARAVARDAARRVREAAARRLPGG